MNKEITLTDFFQFVLAKLKLIIILGLVAAIVVFAGVKVTADTKYNYSGSMLVDPFGNITQDQNSNAVMSELNIAKTLIPTYIAVLESNAYADYIAKAVEDNFNLKVSRGAVQNMLTYTTSTKHLIISYRCSSTDKKLAYAVAKTVDEKTAAFISTIIDHGKLSPVNRIAKDGFGASTPSAPVAAVVAFAIVAVLTVLICLLIELFDDRIKSPEDITERFEYPVLGTIPDFYANNIQEEGYGDEKTKTA